MFLTRSSSQRGRPRTSQPAEAPAQRRSATSHSVRGAPPVLWPRMALFALLVAVRAMFTVASAVEQPQTGHGPLSHDVPLSTAFGSRHVGACVSPHDCGGARGGPAWGVALGRGPAPIELESYVACTSSCQAGNVSTRFRRHFNPYHHLDRPFGLETTVAGAGVGGAAAAEEEEELGSPATCTDGLLHHARRLDVLCLAIRRDLCHCDFSVPLRASSCLSSARPDGLAQRSATKGAEGGTTCDALCFSRVGDRGAVGNLDVVVTGRAKRFIRRGGIRQDLCGRPSACVYLPSFGRVRCYLDPLWTDEAASSAGQRVYLHNGPGQGILPKRGQEMQDEGHEEKAMKDQCRHSDFIATVKVGECRRFRIDLARYEEIGQGTSAIEERRNLGVTGRCWRSSICVDSKVHARAGWNVHIPDAGVVVSNGKMGERGTMRWVKCAAYKVYANARYPRSLEAGRSGRSQVSAATNVSARGNVHHPGSAVVDDNGNVEEGRAIVHWAINVAIKVATKARYLRLVAKGREHLDARWGQEGAGVGRGDGGLEAQCSLQATQGTHHHHVTFTQWHLCIRSIRWCHVHMSRCRPVLVSWRVTRCIGLTPDKGEFQYEGRGRPVPGVSSLFVRNGSHGQHGGAGTSPGQGVGNGGKGWRRHGTPQACHPHARRRGGQTMRGEDGRDGWGKLFRPRFFVIPIMMLPTCALDISLSLPVGATVLPVRRRVAIDPLTLHSTPHGPSGHRTTRDGAGSLEEGLEDGAWAAEEVDHANGGGRSAWHSDIIAFCSTAVCKRGCLYVRLECYTCAELIGDGKGEVGTQYFDVRHAGADTRQTGDARGWSEKYTLHWCAADPHLLPLRPDGKLEAGSTRYGEARHPGPVQASGSGGGDADGNGSSVAIGPVQYRNPFQRGFHGALVTGGAAADSRTQETEVLDGLSIVTCNSTSWGPLRRFLRRTRADIVMAQEHHLGPNDVPAKSAWALRNRWHSVFAPAQPGEGSGWRAGVAIFARPHVGLCHPRAGSHIVVPHRAVAACVQPPGYRLTTLVSLYLEDGKGVGGDNLAHLGEVGKFLNCQDDQVPFVLAGDFQCTPDEVAATGFAASVGGELVACGTPRGTCRTSRTASEIDFFLVSKMLAVGIKEVATVEDAGTRPHVPVVLSFAPKLVTARALILRLPPHLGTERVYGPLPPPPSWSDVAAYVNDLLGMTRTDDFVYDDNFRAHYEAAYEAWADLAEIELVAATATVDAQAMPKYGTRGRRPQLRWRSVLPERPPEPLDDDARLTRWRDLANLLSELKRVAWAIDHADADEDADDELDGDHGSHEPCAQDERRSFDCNLLECMCSIREQLGGLGPHADLADVNDEDADGGQGRQLVRYGDAVVRMRALAGAMIVALRNRVGGEGINGTEFVTGIPGLGDRVNELADDVACRLDHAAAAARNGHASKWKDWIMSNLHAGARNAHRFFAAP